MHLLKTALGCALLGSLAIGSLAQEPSALTEPSLVTPVPQSGQLLPGQNPTNLPPDVTRIDPNCATTNGPTMSATVECLLWRMEQSGGQLVVLNQVTGGAPLRFTNDMDMKFRAGPRVFVDYLAEEGSSFEVGYFGIFDWHAVDTVFAPNTAPPSFLRVPDSFGASTFDYARADSMRLAYDLSLNSVEANLLFGKPNSNTAFIFGGRFVRLDEEYSIRASRTNGLPPQAPAFLPPPWHSDYTINTRNELFGVQMGTRYRACVTDRLELNSFIKLGAYNNNARQSTFVTDQDRTVVLRDFAPERAVASFVGDFNVTANYRINCNWFFRAGYNLLVMTDVARAPDQLDFATNAAAGDGIFFHQQALAHGLNLGLEGRW